MPRAESSLSLLQGIYSSVLDASPATKRLGGALSAAAASFAFVSELLWRHKKVAEAAPLAPQPVAVPQPAVHRSWPSWSQTCGDGRFSDDEEEASDSGDDDEHGEPGDGGEAADDSSSCPSVADTLYSLPDVVTASNDFDLTEPCWVLGNSAHAPAHANSHGHAYSTVAPVPQLQQALYALAAAGRSGADSFLLPKQLFFPPSATLPIPLKRRCSAASRQRSHIHRGSQLCLSLDVQPSFPRASASWFLPSPSSDELLCLPAPVFLPDVLSVGLFCEQGQRTRNEDSAFCMHLEPSAHAACGFSKSVCFGVFDGHGGAEVAEHLTECMPQLVSQRCQHIEQRGVEEIATIMMSVERELQQRFHSEWQPEDRDPGSTALVAAIMDDTLLVANVGDCRLLLISEAVDHVGNRTAFVSNTTTDHHCGRNPNEAARVRSAGAMIDESGYIGSLLEVSRSIGDFQTKSELGSGVIIAEPEVYTWKLGPRDLLAVAVSDGISSVMDDMAICNMVCTHLNAQRRINDPSHAARELANYAALTSTDNCSAVVVVLKDVPPPAPARRRLFGRKA